MSEYTPEEAARMVITTPFYLLEIVAALLQPGGISEDDRAFYLDIVHRIGNAYGIMAEVDGTPPEKWDEIRRNSPHLFTREDTTT